MSFKNLSKEKIFYVYIYLDSRVIGEFWYGKHYFHTEPFYVGKGHGDRWEHHLKEAKAHEKLSTGNKHKFYKIKELLNENRYIQVIKFAENLDELTAFKLEAYLIKLIGRRDLGTGPLTNLTDGGIGGSQGRVLSLETKKKISKAHIGKKASDAAKANMSKGQKNRAPISEETRLKHITASSGENNGMFGKKLSEEHKQKIFLANKGRKKTKEEIEKTASFHRGRKRSKETCERISKSKKGKKLSAKAKENMKKSAKNRLPPSKETCKKLSDALKGKKKSPEHIKHLKESQKDATIKRLKTLSDHPEIKTNSLLKRKETFKNNPSILEGMSKSLKKFHNEHPDMYKERSERWKDEHKIRKIIRDECYSLIKLYTVDVTLLNIPSNKSGLTKWQKFKDVEYIKLNVSSVFEGV